MAANKENRHRFTMLYENNYYQDPIAVQLNNMIDKGYTIINCTGLDGHKVLVEYIPYGG